MTNALEALKTMATGHHSIADANVPEQSCDDVMKYFGEAGIVYPLLAVAAINIWNRLEVAAHQQLPDPSTVS